MDAVAHRRILTEAANEIRRRCAIAPNVGMILGSGLGAYADGLTESTSIPYAEIIGMPSSMVSGHAGNLVLGRRGSTQVVAMQGRVHLYEGHSARDVVFGVRLMAELGAPTLIVTNAAGSVNASLQPGDLMGITDHLNLTGTSSLLGPNLETMGPRFVDMSAAYDAELLARAEAGARELAFELKRGVYAGMLGPAYETPAEIRMLRHLGADAVGMSTVLEVLAARHRGMRVLGVSCITNLGAGLGTAPLHHDEVKETADRVKDRFTALLDAVLEVAS